jgi:thioredoxin-dependent peroxiredoxin
MKHTVTFENTPLSLVGRRVETNSRAWKCTLVDNDAREVTLEDFGEAVKLITFFPSLDTPLCDLQIREYNRRAQALGGLGGGKASVIGISKDLPFAQKRFCETFGIRHMPLLSDYRYSSFGVTFGVLIKEWNLLTRGALIVDRTNTVRYIRLVEELSDPPDFDEAFARLAEVIENPAAGSAGPGPTPRGEVSPLPAGLLSGMMRKIPGWKLVGGVTIVKAFSFPDFGGAKYFIDTVSSISEELRHHHSLTWRCNTVQISLTTRSAGALTENDFIMARIVDQCI